MSMNDIQRILQVLDKYMVERTPAEVSQALTAELDENPLDVYAIACRYNLHGIANFAAKTLLKLPCSRLYGLDEDFSTHDSRTVRAFGQIPHSGWRNSSPRRTQFSS